jgi:hypothetical protein
MPSSRQRETSADAAERAELARRVAARNEILREIRRLEGESKADPVAEYILPHAIDWYERHEAEGW